MYGYTRAHSHIGAETRRKLSEQVGLRYSKPELNGKGFVHFPVCNALLTKSLSIDAALRNERPEERKEAQQKPKVKRRKLKGRRAVAKWLKHFRWKKKKEYERMTPEEKLMYKLKRARRKEERLVAALQKLKPKESSDPTHDPEILTPEEHFYYLKMSHKCKNYVPIGRRGVFNGVILNMHLHWKKHQTVKVIVKTFTPDEVRDIAGELARLTGGIVLDIYEGNTILMYRGKNYAQPPTEIMSPRAALSKRKALDKSTRTESLRSVKIFIAKLEKDLEVIRQKMKAESQINSEHGRALLMSEDQPETEHVPANRTPLRKYLPMDSEYVVEHAREIEDVSESSGTETEHVSDAEFEMASDSEALSDLFETDSEMNSESSDEPDHSLYLDKIDAAPQEDKKTVSAFAEHLSEMPEESEKVDGSADDPGLSELDEVDQMFLRAASLLEKKK